MRPANLIAPLSLAAIVLLSSCNPSRTSTGPEQPFTPDRLPAAPQAEAPPPADPARREIQQLLAQARSELAEGRAGDAEITLWQIRHRAPLHLEANELYQDTRLTGRTSAQVYAEYRPLLARELDSLPALYLTLRPMLIRWQAPKPTGVRATTRPAQPGDYRGPWPEGSGEVAEDPNPAATAQFLRARSNLWEGRTNQALELLAGLAMSEPPVMAVEMLRQDAKLTALLGRSPTDGDRFFPASPPAERWDALLADYRHAMDKMDGIGDGRALYERLARISDPVQSSLRLSADLLGGFASWWGVQVLAETVYQRAVAAEGDARVAGCRLALLLADACIRANAVVDHGPWLVRGMAHQQLGQEAEALSDMLMAANLAGSGNPATRRGE